VLVCGPDRRIEFMNEQFIKRVGKNAKGEDIGEFLHEIEGTCPPCINEKAFSGERMNWEEQYPKDGRWFSIVDVPIRRPDGKVSVLVTIEDVTARKEIEQNLEDNRNRLSALLERAAEWIWELYPNGIFKFSSNKSNELLGFEPIEFSGRSFVDFLVPTEMERISAIYREAVATKGPINSFEHICLHKDGHPVLLNSSAKPFFDSTGTLAGYRFFSMEISDSKKSGSKQLGES